MKNFILTMIAFAILLLAFERPAAPPTETPDRLCMFWQQVNTQTQSVFSMPEFSIENIQLKVSNRFIYTQCKSATYLSFYKLPEFDIQNIRICKTRA